RTPCPPLFPYTTLFRSEAVDRVTTGFGVESVAVEKIHAIECDIHSPCALGASLDAVTIPELHCAAVVGSANNQLAGPECGRLLRSEEHTSELQSRFDLV